MAGRLIDVQSLQHRDIEFAAAGGGDLLLQPGKPAGVFAQSHFVLGHPTLDILLPVFQHGDAGHHLIMKLGKLGFQPRHLIVGGQVVGEVMKYFSKRLEHDEGLTRTMK
jgi:hypothetical protein